MKSITARVVLFVGIAAVAPLVIFGVVSVKSLREGTRRSVIDGNLNVARRVAEQMGLYLSTNVAILHATGAQLQRTGLEHWQQDRILKNYVISFSEFRELTLFDEGGRPIATSRVGAPALQIPGPDAIERERVSIAPIAVDDDLLPRTSVAIRLSGANGPAGWLVGEFNLVKMWRMVDRIRVGERGFALVVAPDGRLIAHGNPNEKGAIARGESLGHHPLVQRLRAQHDTSPVAQEYAVADGATILGVAARVPSFEWTVIVEQPTREAYALAARLERQLAVAIGLALLVTVGFGYFWGRSLIRPITALMKGTRALAEGKMAERVRIETEDEFGRLGKAFNGMADRLVALQDDVRKQERQAMFGRIAVGLVHDLSHPIQNIGNSCKLILKMFDDLEYRTTFKRTVDREFMAIRRVLDDLRNLARPMPLERFPVDVNRSVAEVVETMRSFSEAAGLTIETALGPNPIWIEGDLFALGRVYRNLILNAIQATQPGGVIEVRTELRGAKALVTVTDTGCGIPPDRLGAIFEDFATTKRSGLGLGLAISKKIVEQLDGRITVTSTVGEGSAFALELDAVAQPAIRAAM